jgi:hypothetical protein
VHTVMIWLTPGVSNRSQNSWSSAALQIPSRLRLPDGRIA